VVLKQIHNLNVEVLPVASLKPYAHNPRTHSAKQLRQIADSIRRFGFTNPVLIDADRGVIAGHGRIAAARLLGIDSVPTIRLDQMTEAEKRAYVIADNKLAENAGWDRELLALPRRGGCGRRAAPVRRRQRGARGVRAATFPASQAVQHRG
jgi:ParB-like chromosome segregation protein Spo0J